MIDAKTFKVIHTITGFSAPAGALHVCGKIVTSYDACGVLISDWDADAVFAVNATTYQVIATLPVGTNPEFMGYSPASKDAYVSNANGQSISVISGGKVVSTISLVNAYPEGIAYNPVNKHIYVAGSGHVYVINSKNKVVWTIETTQDSTKSFARR